MTGYNKTVLTLPTDGGPTPFGGNSAAATSSSTSTTASSSSISSSTIVGAAAAATTTAAATHNASLSGGAIAGIAVGAALILGMLAGIIWARIRRQRIKKQDAQAQQNSIAPSYHQGGFMYPQYPKSEPGLSSPPTSAPLFSRNHSDQYGFGSPPQSKQGGSPYSLESLRDSPRPRPNPPFAIPEMSELGQFIPAELPAGDEEQVVDKKHVPREI